MLVNPIDIPDDEDVKLGSLQLTPRGGATVMEPAITLSHNLPEPVLYCQPTHLPICVCVLLDLTLTQCDITPLLVILWFLFTDQ